MSGEQTFWARRKAGVAAEAEAEKAATAAQALAAEHEALEERSDAEILEALELPDPDTMQAGDDFRAFMSKAVPERLRRRALRTLWRTNPVLANVDMLVDYGEDFTDAALVVENLQTAYQVGKGMLKHVEEMARQAEERETPPESAPAAHDETPVAEAPPETPAETPAEAPPETPALAEADNTPGDHPAEEADATPAPRRMRFRTEEQAV